MIEELGTNKFKTPHMIIELELPDIVFVRTKGIVDKQDMLDMTDVLERGVRGWPQVFLLVDQSAQEGMTAEARKVAPDMGDWIPYRGTVMFGGGFAVRTLGQMLMKLINLGRKSENPTTFVKEESEARAWLAQRRRELSGQKG
jgi:hypothetical protein